MEGIYFIRGGARRHLKKKKNRLKRAVRYFWHHNDIDEVYGGGVSKEEGEKIINKLQNDILTISFLLAQKV